MCHIKQTLWDSATEGAPPLTSVPLEKASQMPVTVLLVLWQKCRAKPDAQLRTQVLVSTSSAKQYWKRLPELHGFEEKLGILGKVEASERMQGTLSFFG